MRKKQSSTEQIRLQEFGKRVKALRAEEGMTQEQLAFKLETDQGNIARLENGRINPGYLFLENLAQQLDISPSKLFPDRKP